MVGGHNYNKIKFHISVVVTHKLENNYTIEVFPLLQGSQGPTLRLQPGGLGKGTRTAQEI